MPNEAKRRIALVTGGSSGIGRCIATTLSREGYCVVACARSLAKLEDLQKNLSIEGFDLFPIQVDLRREESIFQMFETIRNKFGGVHVLINSAGVGYHAPLLSSESDLWRETIEVNVLALCICTREAVRDMRNRDDRGHIINIGSLLGHRVGIFPGIYTASKFAVTALTESFRLELRALNSGIRVSQISPGRIETEFHEKYFKDKSKAQTLYSEFKPLEADDIAKAVSYILSQPQHVQVHDILVRPIGQPG